jgi:hypothetical protein
VSVAIEPGVPTVVANTPQPFVATVTGASNMGVTWSVQESAGGDISSTGVYTAPATQGTYHVVATSQADSCVSASVAVTVIPAPTITVAIDPPGPVDVEVQGSVRFLATVTGTSNTGVVWSVQANGADGQINPVSGVYGAPATIGVTNVDVVIATSVADPTKSAQAEVHVLASTSSALISPTEVTVGLGGQLQLTLSKPILAGGWMVDGVVGGNSTVGTISPTGLYTAPFQIPAPTTMVSVTKTNVFNSSSTVMLSTRFLPSETLQVDGCDPQCPNDTPNAIVAADFNGDGFSDLATANTGTGTVSLLISADASHFAVPYRLQVGNPNSGEPQALVVADINQDSTVPNPRLDLVMADADPSGLAVRARLGVGNGTFGDERVTVLPSNSNPLSMAVGQFDSDPDLDVAVANYVTNTVDILQGRSDGTFQPLNPISAGLSGPLSVATADFNRDGWDDLAVANSGSDTVSVLLSNGDGTFAPPQIVQLPTNSSPSAVAVGTFNGGNYPDLVVTTTAPTGGVTIILNSAVSAYDADPRFIARDPLKYPVPTGSFPVAVVIGNFNRDSVPDVVVANQRDGTVTTYFFDAGGYVLVESETYTVGQTPQALAVGDFNGDGWDDVAVVNNDDDTVSILRNRGGPTTSP